MECYLLSTMHEEGKLILHFPVSPFHKYDTLIFIIPHALSFGKEITGDSLFSLHRIFPIRIPSFANNQLFVARGFAAKFQAGLWSSAQPPFKKEVQIKEQLYF